MSKSIVFVMFGPKLITFDIKSNNTTREGWISLKNILGIYQTGSKEYVDKWFREYLGGKRDLFYVYQARIGLYLLLKSLNLPEDSEVIYQGFTCVVVPNAILQAGLTPVMVDIEDVTYNLDLNKLEKQITSKTKVLIVQHNFGLPINIEKAKQICNKHSITLIEDCAHALNSVYNYKGKQYNVGTLGDASIFSFGRDKVVSTVSGGLAVINKEDPKWIGKMQKEYSKLTNPPRSTTFQSFYYIFITSIVVQPLYNVFKIGRIVLRLSQKTGLMDGVYTIREQKSTIEVEHPYLYDPALFEILASQLKNLNKVSQHRKQIARMYSSAFGQKYDESANYMRFVLDLKRLNVEENYFEILEKARKNGIILGKWYNSLVLPRSVDLDNCGYKGKETLPIAENLSNNRVINLPTHIHVTKEDAKHIIRMIKSFKS